MRSRPRDRAPELSAAPIEEEEMSAALIRDLNDSFRKSFTGGRVVITQGVQTLAPIDQAALIVKVRAFSTFDDVNDPYGEHDFGSVEIQGEKFFWKIDYYDLSLMYGSPDPTDPALTTRVLTIMRVDEY